MANPFGRIPERATIFSVIVWYNPSPNDAENILSYCSSVDRIVIVDNSETENSQLIPPHLTVAYIPLMKNMGIGYALNVGCEYSKQHGANYILALDQDSRFEGNGALFYLARALKTLDACNLAIIGPTWVSNDQRRNGVKRISQSLSVITSGSVFTLSTWGKVSGFDESLFIDQVDHDFCKKISMSGGSVYLYKTKQFKHKVGNPKSITIYGKKVTSSCHDANRRYYVVRNRFVLARRYNTGFSKVVRMTVFDMLALLLLDKRRGKKILAMAHGIFDFGIGRLGPRSSYKPNK